MCRDYALAYWLKSCGGLDSEVVPTLEFFFQACAIEVRAPISLTVKPT
jgi:glutaminase